MPHAKTAKPTPISSRAARALAAGKNANQSANGHEYEYEHESAGDSESESAVLKALSEISEEATQRTERATKARAAAPRPAPKPGARGPRKPKPTGDEVAATQTPNGPALLNIAAFATYRMKAVDGHSREKALNDVLEMYRVAVNKYLDDVNEAPDQNGLWQWLRDNYPTARQHLSTVPKYKLAARAEAARTAGPTERPDEAGETGEASDEPFGGEEADGEEGEEGEEAEEADGDVESVGIAEWGTGADADADTERSAPSDE